MTSNENYQTFSTYDHRYLQIRTGTGTTPNVITSLNFVGAVACTPETIIGPNGYQTPTQANQLIALFQMYQEWRLKKVSVTWHPQYSRPDMAAEMAARQTNSGGTAPPVISAINQSLATIYKNGATMTLIEDDTDTIVEASNDEMFMIMSHPRAMTHNIFDTFTYDVTPNTMDVQMVPNLIGSGPGSQPFTQNPTAGNMNLALTRPVRLDWQSTRRWVNGNPGNPAGLNYDLKGYGFKYYVRAPWHEWDQRVAAQDIYLGFFTFNYVFEFRNQEFRKWTLLPSLAAARAGADESLDFVSPEPITSSNVTKSIERTVNQEPTFKRLLSEEEAAEREAKIVRMS